MAVSLRESVFPFLADPNIALVVFIVGALLVYAEFTMPGTVLPGAIGTALLVTALSAFSMLPVNWFGAGLIALAMVLFILEAKFISHGILTAAGAVAMALGAMMLIDSRGNSPRIHAATAIGLALPFALITSFLLSIAAKARNNKVVTGPDAMLNRIGTVTEELNPNGIVMIRGEYWKARASRQPVERGSKVIVTRVEGLTLQVEQESNQ